MIDHEALEAEVVREDDSSKAFSSTSNAVASDSDVLTGALYLLPLSKRSFFPAQSCHCCSEQTLATHHQSCRQHANSVPSA